ncbi:SSI family serine proteinase inhibitor [Streptomyces sp. NPDC047072]|uniref:SSI family serine proteinase inhibitor n=1 Tax=Streptomyces sp. NPDC047072 TaxID=3154809 RepID=UPI00340E0506
MTYTITAAGASSVVRRVVRAALPAAAVLLLAAAAPVSAQQAGGNWLFVSVTTGDGRSSDTRGTLLLCNPPQGHGRAAEACAQLAAAGGDIEAVPPADVACPMIYAPVTAKARGQWDGRPVEYQETFSNGCVLAARTGAVFALDG